MEDVATMVRFLRGCTSVIRQQTRVKQGRSLVGWTFDEVVIHLTEYNDGMGDG